MYYESTRNNKIKKSFKEVLLTGLSDDGGLYIPKKWPKVSKKEFSKIKRMNYQQIAFHISKKFIKCKTLNCPPTIQPNHTNIQVKKQILKYKKDFLFLVNILLKIKTKAAIEIVIISKKIFMILFDQIIMKLLLALEEITLFSLKLFK